MAGARHDEPPVAQAVEKIGAVLTNRREMLILHGKMIEHVTYEIKAKKAESRSCFSRIERPVPVFFRLTISRLLPVCADGA
jgi:hypothetical protein